MQNRIKGFFIYGKRSAEEIVNFKKYIENYKDAMDVVNAVLLVEGCTRSGFKVKDIISWTGILNAMERPSSLLSSSIVYRGISCVRKMDADEYEGQKFLKNLWEQTVKAKVVLDETDICPAIYSMQTLNANTPASKNFIKIYADALESSRKYFPAKVRTLQEMLFVRVW